MMKGVLNPKTTMLATMVSSDCRTSENELDNSENR